MKILFMATILFVPKTSTKEMIEIEALGAKATHCTYEYAFDMYGAHCAGLRLTKIPKLRGGLEVVIILKRSLTLKLF